MGKKCYFVFQTPYFFCKSFIYKTTAYYNYRKAYTYDAPAFLAFSKKLQYIHEALAVFMPLDTIRLLAHGRQTLNYFSHTLCTQAMEDQNLYSNKHELIG